VVAKTSHVVPPPGEAEVRALKRLPGRLAREGFVDAFVLYGPYNSRSSSWAQHLPLLPERLRLLFRLFLLGEPVDVDELVRIVPEPEVAALERLLVLHRDGGRIDAGPLAAIPLSGHLVFADRPCVDPVVYFGEDSAALAAHLSPPSRGECLDLCTGPGVQALLASSRARRVVAVEINPGSAAYAKLNAVMNDVEDKVDVRVGDLYGAVPDESFDFISANPPLLPFPEQLPYPFVGHGGADGLSITRRIVEGLPRALRPEGLCQIIGTCSGDERGPACEAELERTARSLDLDITMTIPSAHPLEPGAPMFEGLAWSCATAAGLDLGEVRARFHAHLQGSDTTRIYLFFLAISRAARGGRLRVTRHYRAGAGFWFI